MAAVQNLLLFACLNRIYSSESTMILDRDCIDIRYVILAGFKIYFLNFEGFSYFYSCIFVLNSCILSSECIHIINTDKLLSTESFSTLHN